MRVAVLLSVALLVHVSLGLPAQELLVVDLSRSPAPAVAEALRKSPDAPAKAMPEKRTAAILADARGVGVSCTSTDDVACLEKLLVLARVHTVVAFAVDNSGLSLVKVGDGTPVSARARRTASPSLTAKLSWLALEKASARTPDDGETKTPKPDRPVETKTPPDKRPDKPPDKADRPDEPDDKPVPPTEASTATQNGLPLSLLAAIGGAAGTLVLGGAAVAVSAELARQQLATQEGVPLQDNYQALDVLFWTLGAAAGVSLVVGVAGTVLFLAPLDGDVGSESSGDGNETRPAALSAP